ncbi:hypothetical protein [Frateuria sp. YIM B11624]|uniref:hypothetical protein n=1 Tax=Frateuria sp. YIM B11624 TaxID=3143185 RepID=UPI003C74C9EF
MEIHFNQLLEWLTANQGITNALATIASAVAALLALFVSFVSLVVAGRSVRVQHKHNKLSVRPLPEVTVADFENILRVKLRNHGSGPLLIKSLRVHGYDGSHETLVDAVPALPQRLWTNFCGNVDGRSLLPGSEIVLLELVEEKGELGFKGSRDLARKALALAVVSVDYSDVYESGFQPYKKSLEWFGRHWATA